MSLTLAMIVKNEEAHLGHCLDSVQGLADELIVVDTGSTDGTVAVAEARDALVLRFPWTGHFADARNAGLAAATGDWVLVLDADEAVDAKDFPIIRAAMDQEAASAYRLIVRNYVPDSTRSSMDQPLTPNPGGYDEGAAYALCGDGRILRLFRRLPGVAFTGRLHELMDPFFEERGLPIAPLDAVIHHYGQTLPDRVDRKLTLYLDLARKDVQDRPEVFQSHHNLVLQAASAQDWATVLEAAADLERRFPQRPTSTVLFAQGMALQNLGRHGEALAAFDHLLTLSPGHDLAFLRRGPSLAALGRPDEARRAYRAALHKNPRLLLAYVLLAELDQGLGDAAGARAALLEGTRACPADPALWVRLLGLDLAMGATDLAAQDAWSAIQACPGGGAGHWHSLVGLALLRRGDREQGRAVLNLGLQAFPGHPALTRLLEL